jgi:hypothetical protein
MHAPVKTATLATAAAAKAAGLKPCDCLNDCGDDTDIAAGKAVPCQRFIDSMQAQEDQRQLARDGLRMQELCRVMAAASGAGASGLDAAYFQAMQAAMLKGTVQQLRAMIDSSLAARAAAAGTQ